MTASTKQLEDALVQAIEDYNHNLPDILEVIIHITFRELYKQAGYNLRPFRDQAHELIDLT